MDPPPLCAGRRIHPARRGHRAVPETRNRQAHHPLAGQPASRLRNTAEQILLPLPATHAREGVALRVLEAGEAGGRDTKGTGGELMKPGSQPVIEWLGTTPQEWSQPRLKAVFRDNTGAISMQQLADLAVQHSSLPNFEIGRAHV